MSKKVKLPRTRLSVELDNNVYTPREYTLWFYVDGFEAMPVHTYTKRSDAVRGAKRFAVKVYGSDCFDELVWDQFVIPIFVDGDEIL